MGRMLRLCSAQATDGFLISAFLRNFLSQLSHRYESRYADMVFILKSSTCEDLENRLLGKKITLKR
ncbi:hypothetical protein CLV31_10592 [Algoriphagus aquaeductus]|uniref:Uncharacterized protein n=1 Tax=Algoriphagus aquaeductus TaxID=475299 RepID=A0A326RT37_9BACT|nr:hypothetical protein CLV31_10592 [Algoriphagus aquaeductus]